MHAIIQLIYKGIIEPVLQCAQLMNKMCSISWNTILYAVIEQGCRFAAGR